MPVVLVIGVGGTISSTDALPGAGSQPTLDSAALVNGLTPPAGVTLEAMDFRLLPSASVSLADVCELADVIKTRVRSGGVTAVVVTHGTDTIEETAFGLDLLGAANEVPVVVTGAMRSPNQDGPDGPANLHAAIVTALSEQAPGCGVLVVFDEAIHSARWVTKATTHRSWGFSSAPLGPIGWVAEERAVIALRPVAHDVLPRPRRRPQPVPIWQVAPADDLSLLTGLTDAGAPGLVLAGLGGGHVGAQAVERLTAVAARIPVILSTRVSGGPVLTRTYGYAGSEIQLQELGCIPSHGLNPAKAQVLLSLLLALDVPRNGICDYYARR